MDRQEVCAKLNEMREKYRLSWFDLSVSTLLRDSTLRQIFRGESNTFVETIMRIFSPFNASFVLTKRDARFEIFNIEDLLKWAEYSRERSKMNINTFARAMGVNYNSISSYLSRKTKMRIDTFLKWCEVTGYIVQINYRQHPHIL